MSNIERPAAVAVGQGYHVYCVTFCQSIRANGRLLRLRPIGRLRIGDEMADGDDAD
jgi:hypothetical protein